MKQIKYALFACRSAPNRNSGLSPFEIVFGRNVRELLELLRDMWDTQEKRTINVCAWIQELDKRLEIVRNVHRKKMTITKDKLKKHYDQKVRLREL